MFGLSSCATSDATLREGGKSEAYIKGYNDGRHSGMHEAGNFLVSTKRDATLFENNADYKEGWLAGEQEGVKIQTQSNAGVGAAGTVEIMKEAEKSKPDAKAIGRDATKGVDTSTLKNLK